MRSSDLLIKTTLYFLGALATIAFMITKSPEALYWTTSGDYRYGDLYRFSKIQRFKPSTILIRGKFDNQDSIDQGKLRPKENDSVFLGDSFSFCDWGETPFWMQLQKKLGIPVFSIFNNHHESFWKNPYLLLNPPTHHLQSQRVLVYEIVERSIQYQFSQPISTNAILQNTNGIPASSLWPEIKGIVFDNSEERHETLLKHNPITSPMIKLWNTALFELFRQIPSDTPLYSLNPPFLFYQGEVNSFQSIHDERMIVNLADNIALLANNLQQHFGYTLIFLPVPNKITVYSRYVSDKPYDDFVPRLCLELKKRNVCTIELLPALQKQSGFFYWPTDTHWNNLGISLAVQKTFENWPQ